jgi:hypothetical protein
MSFSIVGSDTYAIRIGIHDRIDVKDDTLFVNCARPWDSFQHIRPGCALMGIICYKTTSIIPMVELLARGGMRSITRIEFMNYHMPGMDTYLRYAITDLMTSPSSSIRTVIDDAFNTDFNQIISSVVESPQCRIRRCEYYALPPRVVHCLAMHRVGDLLIVLLDRFHHHILRQVKSFLL